MWHLTVTSAMPRAAAISLLHLPPARSDRTCLSRALNSESGCRAASVRVTGGGRKPSPAWIRLKASRSTWRGIPFSKSALKIERTEMIRALHEEHAHPSDGVFHRRFEIQL